MPKQLNIEQYRIIRIAEPGHWLSVPHRLLSIDSDSGDAYVFRMRLPMSRPKVVPWSFLMDEWLSGHLLVEEFKPPDIMLLPEEDLPEPYKVYRDKWWSTFEPLLGDERYRLLYEEQGATIADFAEAQKLQKKTVYRFVYRFFFYGCVSNAFLPRFDLRGGAGRRRMSGATKLGRPRKAFQLGYEPVNAGVVVSEEDEAYFLWALQTFWTQGKPYTFKKTYEELCKKYYAEKRDARIHLRKDRPSYQQFVSHAKRLPQFSVLLRQRIGEKKWDRTFRAITQRSGAEVLGPTDRYQIDATIADVYLTSIYNRNWIIGRPVIYVVVDVFSGYIVGLFVGLEGPSWEGARLALLNAFTDKREFLARHGFDPSVQWLAHHIPGSIMADRAELLGNNARGLVSGLGIAIDIASGFRPDWKGLVEQQFRILNDEVIHFLPGAVLKRVRERGERDYALDGTLNIHEFTKIIIRNVLHSNVHHSYEDRCTSAMIEENVKPTPEGLWAFGMEHLVGGTPQRSAEEIYAHLLPRATASVREDGIHFKGLRYTSPYAMENRWFERARYEGRFSVDVKYHPETPGQLWIVDRSQKGMRLNIHGATLLDPFDRYGHARLEEAVDMLEIEKLKLGDLKESKLENRLEITEENQADVARAKKDCRDQQVDISDRRKKMNIRQHHGDEKQRQRQTRAAEDMKSFDHSTTPPSASSSTCQNDAMAPVDLMIWKMLRNDKEVP